MIRMAKSMDHVFPPEIDTLNTLYVVALYVSRFMSCSNKENYKMVVLEKEIGISVKVRYLIKGRNVITKCNLWVVNKQ